MDATIANLIEEQRQVDSANHDPKAQAMEFDVIDGPPIRFSSAAGRGYIVKNDCGDCGSTSMLFSHPGYVATVDFGSDDDIKNPAARGCEMDVLARSFLWRDDRH
jgi:hypothetical protein